MSTAPVFYLDAELQDPADLATLHAAVKPPEAPLEPPDSCSTSRVPSVPAHATPASAPSQSTPSQDRMRRG
jgi:hypothetical protein